MTNQQGDATAILDSTGAVMVNYHYYGVLLQTGGTMATTLGALNPLTYRVCIEDRFKPTHAVGPPKPKLSYINDQEDENIRGMSLGLSNIKNSGCGVVASYNALIDLGCGSDFEYVLAEYNWGLGIRLYWLGLAGIRKAATEVIMVVDCLGNHQISLIEQMQQAR